MHTTIRSLKMLPYKQNERVKFKAVRRYYRESEHPNTIHIAPITYFSSDISFATSPQQAKMKFMTIYVNAVALCMMMLIIVLLVVGGDHYSVKAHQAVSSSLLPHDHHRLEMTLRRFHSPHQEELQEEIKQTFHHHVKQLLLVLYYLISLVPPSTIWGFS